MRSSIRRFHKKDFFCICTLIIHSPGVFNINCSFFCRVVNILYFHAFSTIIGLFSGDIFVLIHTEAIKKVLETKVSNWQDFISGDFLIKGLFFHGTLRNIRTYYTETFFQELFLAVTRLLYLPY